jgi:hypothetical protein
MTKDILPDSLDKDYPTHLKQVADLAEKTKIPYTIPTTMEAATCILMHHVHTGENLYRANPYRYTRCQEAATDGSWSYMVGGFSFIHGLMINMSNTTKDTLGQKHIGVAVGYKLPVSDS